MQTDEVKKLLGSGFRYEVDQYDRAFFGENAQIKEAWKQLDKGGTAGMIKVKVP